MDRLYLFRYAIEEVFSNLKAFECLQDFRYKNVNQADIHNLSVSKYTDICIQTQVLDVYFSTFTAATETVQIRNQNLTQQKKLSND